MYSTYANAFRYPFPGLAEQLAAEAGGISDPHAREALLAFLDGIRKLTLGAWEELYTHTWDLDPPAPPYIGFQIWGEDYRRGNFLARLQGAYRRSGIDPGSELPDHLVPVLCYLDAAAAPIEELSAVLQTGLAKMCTALRQNDPDNPYLGLLEAFSADVNRRQANHETLEV